MPASWFRFFCALASVLCCLSLEACQSTTASQRYRSQPVSREEIAALESERNPESTADPSSEQRRFSESVRLASIGKDAKTRLNEEINRYLGAKYRYGGQDANGFDCSGFTGKVFRDALRIELPRSSAAQAQIGTPVDPRDLQFGDLVFFNIYGRGISHVGIYIGNGNFVHASVKIGVTVSNLQERYYKQRYVTARRILKF